MKISRRQSFYLGGGAVALIGAGSGARFLLRKRYAPSPYDDLLASLENRDGAAQIGETVLGAKENFDPMETAAKIRTRMKGHSLSELTQEDARKGDLIEAAGWVMPQTLAFVCALAAKAAA
jgi:hypothetical protein